MTLILGKFASICIVTTEYSHRYRSNQTVYTPIEEALSVHHGDEWYYYKYRNIENSVYIVPQHIIPTSKNTRYKRCKLMQLKSTRWTRVYCS